MGLYEEAGKVHGDDIYIYRIDTGMVRVNPRVTPDLIPLGRYGAVQEVADVAVILACKAISPVTQSM